MCMLTRQLFLQAESPVFDKWVLAASPRLKDQETKVIEQISIHVQPWIIDVGQMQSCDTRYPGQQRQLMRTADSS